MKFNKTSTQLELKTYFFLCSNLVLVFYVLNFYKLFFNSYTTIPILNM